jgi:hypothetical protein
LCAGAINPLIQEDLQQVAVYYWFWEGFALYFATLGKVDYGRVLTFGKWLVTRNKQNQNTAFVPSTRH